MHGLKAVNRPIAVVREKWENLPLSPRVRRMYEKTGNVIVVDLPGEKQYEN